MNRKQIVIALSAATLSLSAFAASAAQPVRIGDENNLEWLPATKTSASAAQTGVAHTGSSQFVHIGDENNLDWLPTAPKR
jgi:opacity protein-like surface antigen